MNIKNKIKSIKEYFKRKISWFKFNSPVIRLLEKILDVCRYKKDVLKSGAIIRSQIKLNVKEIFEIKKFKMFVLLVAEIDGYIVLDKKSFDKAMREFEKRKEKKK